MLSKVLIASAAALAIASVAQAQTATGGVGASTGSTGSTGATGSTSATGATGTTGVSIVAVSDESPLAGADGELKGAPEGVGGSPPRSASSGVRAKVCATRRL